MRISRQSFPVKIITDQKLLENVEFFEYLASMLTNDGRCTCETEPRIVMPKLHSIRRGLFLLTHWT